MTDIFIQDNDSFYLENIRKEFEKHGYKVFTNSNLSKTIDWIKEHEPSIVILQRQAGSIRKSLIVQMSEELILNKSRVFLSNDLELEESDSLLVHSLGFEKLYNRPLSPEQVKELIHELEPKSKKQKAA